MQDLFIKEAIANHVLPIDDRTVERFDAKIAGRPDLMAGRTSLTLYPGMSVNENSFINLKNASHTITADVDIPAGGASGVILAQGGKFGGWSFYLKDGKPTYHYNFLGLAHYTVASDKPLPPGKATVQLRIYLRRRRPRQGRNGAHLRQRREGRRGAHRQDPMLPDRARRERRRRQEQRHAGQPRLRQPVRLHRDDRPRRGRPDARRRRDERRRARGGGRRQGQAGDDRGIGSVT